MICRINVDLWEKEYYYTIRDKLCQWEAHNDRFWKKNDADGSS